MIVRVIASSLLILVVGAADVALAHPVVDRGISYYEAAEFDRALRAFGRAEQRDDLTRADLVQLLLHRALVLHAVGRLDEMEEDLTGLASLEPELGLPRVAPRVREAFDSARRREGSALALEVELLPVPGGATLRARVIHDPGDLTRAVIIFARVGDGDWESMGSEEVTVRASDTEEIGYYAIATGPGGAQIVWEGQEDSPRTTTRARIAMGDEVRTETRTSVRSSAAHTDDEDDEDDEGGSALPWVVTGIVVGVLGVVAVILAVSLGGGASPETIVTPPEAEL